MYSSSFLKESETELVNYEGYIRCDVVQMAQLLESPHFWENITWIRYLHGSKLITCECNTFIMHNIGNNSIVFFSSIISLPFFLHGINCALNLDSFSDMIHDFFLFFHNFSAA